MCTPDHWTAALDNGGPYGRWNQHTWRTTMNLDRFG